MPPFRGSGGEARLETARCALQSCRRAFTFDPSDFARHPSFPFCSPLCRGADLGAWVNEEYRVEAPMLDEEILDDPELLRRLEGGPTVEADDDEDAEGDDNS